VRGKAPEYQDMKMHEKKTEKKPYDRRDEKAHQNFDNSFGDECTGSCCCYRSTYKTQENGMA
jgi:hypothetical protein